MAVAREVDRLQRDIDAYCSRIYKTNPGEPGYQRLPKCWNNKDRAKSLKLSHFSLTVSYVGGCTDRHAPNSSQDAGAVRADSSIPLSTGIYYFEITISSKGGNGWSLSIGVQQKGSNLSKHTGMEHTSFGLHNDGCLYHWSGSSAVKFAPRSAETDTLGCGVDFISRSLFFTRNGIFLGKAFEGKIPADPGTRLYPAIGLRGRGVRISTNFGQRPFSYAFDLHIQRERLAEENQFVSRLCKEDFAGPKMKELVSGYLVHHGYVATAQSFSRWTALPITSTSCPGDASGAQSATDSPMHSSSAPCLGATHAVSCESHLDSNTDTTNHTSSLPRRHSDGFFTNSDMTSCPSHLPGFASMIHRRRLRALCRRYQYGRAATTLHRLYPQVLERCPELLVQLRCRQLIEMMRRHALRRGRVHQLSEGSPNSDTTHSAVAPAKVQRLSDSQDLWTACCVTDRSSRISRTALNSSSSTNATTAGPMEIDPDTSGKSAEAMDDSHSFTDDPDVDGGDDLVGDDDDDDDFGTADDTGVCEFTVPPSTHQSMEVDNEKTTGTDNGPNLVGKNEIPCLLKHVQFGRSLVNLVKQVRAKTGGLSFETEKLLQQSVSLLAYSSPVSTECPLNGLFDPSWRDTVANIINSAVLKAHDLPVQPALEQGLLALRRCLKDPQFVEGQTLGHFLLYHLTPSQLAKAAPSTPLRTITTRRSGPRLKKRDLTSCPSSGSSRKSPINGHVSGRRRRRCGEPVCDNQQMDDVDPYTSSLDDVFIKDEEDEETEDEDRASRSDTCRPDDESSNGDDDDDDRGPDDDPTVDIRRRPRTRRFADVQSNINENSHHSPGSNPSQVGGGRTQTGSLRLQSSFTHGPITTRPSVIARCVPTLILEPARTHLVASIPQSTRRLVHRTISVDTPLIPVSSSIPGTRQTDQEIPPNQYLDSSFNGLLSLSYPRHTEFLSAVNDALKAYAGSLLVTEGDFPGPSILFPHSRRHQRDEPPPDAGANNNNDMGSSCVP